MSEYRENLLDRMVAIYGLENAIVVEFACLAEKWEDNQWNDKVLCYLVQAHELNPVME